VPAGIQVSVDLDLGHADADLDGTTILYIARTSARDSFFRNNGDGTFTDVSKQAIGIDTKKGMNVDWGDIDNDGLFDVFVTNITDELHEGRQLPLEDLGDLRSPMWPGRRAPSHRLGLGGEVSSTTTTMAGWTCTS